MPSEDASIAALRAKNQAKIEKYLNDSGISRLECFTEDGIKELTFATYPSIFSPDNETPISWNGKDALRETFLYNKETFREMENAEDLLHSRSEQILG
jgi:hypothetical protein